MPSRATRAAGTRRETCASCTDGVIIGIISRSDTKRQRLEPCAGQLARTVLRGGGRSNAISLPDYSYGRRQIDPRRKQPGRPSTGRVVRPPDEWHALLRDRVPAYISWDTYHTNLERLRLNRSLAE